MKVLLGRKTEPTSRWSVRWIFEPKDIWIGVFWNSITVYSSERHYTNVYIGILPFLPICITKTTTWEDLLIESMTGKK